MATIAGFLAACDRLARTLAGYENDVDVRCDPNANKRDCSTFVNFALAEAGYGGIPLCANSFWQAGWCHDQPRPQWFTDRFGPGVGTFITYEQAQTVVCLGFAGADFGRREDADGHDHVEVILGRPGGSKRSVGAHSHATGVGYDDDGLDTHHLSFFAVPPVFLAEMAPPPWKVQPMYNPPLEVVARLHNPQGGWWEAYADGRVELLAPNGTIVSGGMVSQSDRAAFSGRRVAQLKLRWYKPKGKFRKKAGYTIVTTSDEKYVPSAQH